MNCSWSKATLLAVQPRWGRDKEFQAILPLRGKVLNSWETERDRLFANNEIHDISVAIGVDPQRPERQSRSKRTALRKNLHPGRCRRRRFAHPGPIADTLFQALPTPDCQWQYLHCPPPAVSRRCASTWQKADPETFTPSTMVNSVAIEDKLRKDGAKDGAWSISRF